MKHAIILLTKEMNRQDSIARDTANFTNTGDVEMGAYYRVKNKIAKELRDDYLEAIDILKNTITKKINPTRPGR